MDEARAFLEDLEANGPTWEPGDPLNAGLFPTLASGAMYTPANLDTIWLLDTNPENSWLDSPSLLIARFGTYALDGTLVAAPGSIFETISGTPIPTGPMDLYTGYGCSFTFWWHEARQMWLVASGVGCYG